MIEFKKIIVSKENLELHRDALIFLYQNFNDEYIKNNFNYSELKPKQTPEVDFKKEIKEAFNHDVFCEIIFSNENPIGYILGYTEDISNYFGVEKIAFCDGIFVVEEFRGSKIGTGLLADFYGWAKSKGITIVRLNVKARNSKAICFYESLGFITDSYRMFKNIENE